MPPDDLPRASLTIALDDPHSAINQFFDECLPHHDRLVDPWARALRGKQSRHPSPDLPFAHLTGPAIEFRIGYDLADSLPYLELSTPFDPGADPSLFRVLGYVPPPQLPDAAPHLWRRSAEAVEHVHQGNVADQLRGLHHCWRMAYVDKARRALSRTRLTTEQSPRLWPTANRITITSDTTNALIGCWRNYLTFGRRQMHTHAARATVRPVFAAGFGVGDLLLGHTLVDIKFTHDPQDGLARCLRQIVAYALADLDDHHGILNIGIYHAREAHLNTWPLAHALDAMTTTNPTPIAALRSQFADVIHREQAAIPRRTHG